MTWIAPMVLGVFLYVDLEVERYRPIIEQKFGAPLERFEVISLSPTTKVLWFDWQREWWGGMNVIETTKDGTPLYWYDIAGEPTANSIERMRVVNIDGENLLEVIDCTHMGNGHLYIYRIDPGCVRRILRARVITTGIGLRFSPRIANIEYRDLDGDGDEDLVIDAEWIDSDVPEDSSDHSGLYHREFLFDNRDFQENREKRLSEQFADD